MDKLGGTLSQNKGYMSLTTKFLTLGITIFGILTILLVSAAKVVIQNSFETQVKASVVNNLLAETQHLRPTDFEAGDPVRATETFAPLYARIKTSEIIRIKVWNPKKNISR